MAPHLSSEALHLGGYVAIFRAEFSRAPCKAIKGIVRNLLAHEHHASVNVFDANASQSLGLRLFQD